MSATAKRHLREVLDAGRDLFGSQAVNSSDMTGWTTQVASFLQGFGAPGSVVLTYYLDFEDSGGNFPVQDGVTVDQPGNTAAYTQTFTNVGLKHYQHQMQAMKGYNLAGDFNNSSPSVTGVTDVHEGSGTYKTSNISMGDMRGFKYDIGNNSFWSSTVGGTVEYLENTGAISVGDGA